MVSITQACSKVIPRYSDRTITLAIVCVISISGCGGGGGNETPPAPQPPKPAAVAPKPPSREAVGREGVGNQANAARDEKPAANRPQLTSEEDIADEDLQHSFYANETSGNYRVLTGGANTGNTNPDLYNMFANPQGITGKDFRIVELPTTVIEARKGRFTLPRTLWNYRNTAMQPLAGH